MRISEIDSKMAAILETSMAWMRKKDGSSSFPETDFEEYSYVHLAHPVTHEGIMLPAGLRGAIVEKYPDGAGYIVEFTYPHYMVVTLSGKDLKK